VRVLLAAVLCLGFGAAMADEGAVVTYGHMSDADFYAAVSCGAVPGWGCRSTPVRWPHDRARRLSVSLAMKDDGYPAATAARISAAIDHAIRQINGAGADLRLRRHRDETPADIAVRLYAVSEGRRATGTGVADLEGRLMTAGYVSVDYDAAYTIRRGRILLAADVGDRNVESIVLEELTQALGLLFDIDDAAYQSTSVFAERGDDVTNLTGQDADALRRHYPPSY
jgi:lipoate-protein ligase A